MQCFDFHKFLLTLQKNDLNESYLWAFACVILQQIVVLHTPFIAALSIACLFSSKNATTLAFIKWCISMLIQRFECSTEAMPLWSNFPLKFRMYTAHSIQFIGVYSLFLLYHFTISNVIDLKTCPALITNCW